MTTEPKVATSFQATSAEAGMSTASLLEVLAATVDEARWNQISDVATCLVRSMNTFWESVIKRVYINSGDDPNL